MWTTRVLMDANAERTRLFLILRTAPGTNGYCRGGTRPSTVRPTKGGGTSRRLGLGASPG